MRKNVIEKLYLLSYNSTDMAICLGKNFKSCSSLVFICRRVQQNLFFERRIFIASAPIFKQMISCNYFPHKRSYGLKVTANSHVSPSEIYHRRKANCCYRSKNHIVNDATHDLSSRLEDSAVLFATECNAYVEDKKKPISDENLGKPDRDQLYFICKVLNEDLPKLFSKTMNYSIYHPNILFENNIRGTKTRGILSYCKEIFFVRLMGNIKFAYVTLNILKITAHPENGTVRVRWRIKGISNWKMAYNFIKHKTFTKTTDLEGWYDGFSVFYVKSDGLIHKHIVDKMIPDSEEKIPNMRNQLEAKVALTIGILIEGFHNSSL